MSTWHNIYEPTDVDFNEDDNTVEVFIGSDYGGNIYVSIPVAFITKVLPNSDIKAI